MQQQRHSADGSSQTESDGIIIEDDTLFANGGNQQRISRLHATLVEVCTYARTFCRRAAVGWVLSNTAVQQRSTVGAAAEKVVIDIDDENQQRGGWLCDTDTSPATGMCEYAFCRAFRSIGQLFTARTSGPVPCDSVRLPHLGCKSLRAQFAHKQPRSLSHQHLNQTIMV